MSVYFHVVDYEIIMKRGYGTVARIRCQIGDRQVESKGHGLTEVDAVLDAVSSLSDALELKLELPASKEVSQALVGVASSSLTVSLCNVFWPNQTVTMGSGPKWVDAVLEAISQGLDRQLSIFSTTPSS